MTDACLVMTTCDIEETALNIAAALVDQRLAACVSIIRGVKSYYFFEGKTHLDEEVQLLIKTQCALFNSVADKIKELHTYDVPEILMFRADAGAGLYLKWIEDTVLEQ
jgi:periplasmic divalent cation tolerance protein